MYQTSEQIMKIPFHTVIGPLLRRNKYHINTVCTHPVLAFAPFYVGVLGALGVVSQSDILLLTLPIIYNNYFVGIKYFRHLANNKMWASLARISLEGTFEKRQNNSSGS